MLFYTGTKPALTLRKKKNGARGCSRTRIQGTIFGPTTEKEQGNGETSVTRNLAMFENRDDFKNAGLFAISPDTAANLRKSLHSCLHTHHSGMSHPKIHSRKDHWWRNDHQSINTREATYASEQQK